MTRLRAESPQPPELSTKAHRGDAEAVPSASVDGVEVKEKRTHPKLKTPPPAQTSVAEL